ncbi:LacI family DNA-binding transcriptional regulator [Paenibacillus campi]|uniref:LacI family DNA-binding transcriptional regulator n=1 Tax=Paenibacillus campi TaxID=3106031 RepID=UPI002AFF5541|nr:MULTISPECIES: LacI family DNA-binding transcriptional regulator [unclassified Paenibacillus]
MASIQEVAREAGVSTATVSRVINNHPFVSDKSRQSVEKAIRKLNYEPNMMGRNLRTASTNMLLVLLPSISNPFYSKILQGIQDTARRKGYYILVCETDASSEIQSFFINTAKQQLAAGIISLDPSLDLEDVLLPQLQDGYPIIQCGDSPQNDSIPYVSIDNTMAAYKAVKYLLATGHTQIALITASDDFRYATARREGYAKALAESGIELSEELISRGEVDYEGGRLAMQKLLTLDQLPTAVFAIGDIMAIGALKAIREAGLHTPSDIAVIGFDNIPFSNMTTPTLTTVSQPMYDMGCSAAQMMIDKLNQKEKTIKSLILSHELMIRESTEL